MSSLESLIHSAAEAAAAEIGPADIPPLRLTGADTATPRSRHWGLTPLAAAATVARTTGRPAGVRGSGAADDLAPGQGGPAARRHLAEEGHRDPGLAAGTGRAACLRQLPRGGRRAVPLRETGRRRQQPAVRRLLRLDGPARAGQPRTRAGRG